MQALIIIGHGSHLNAESSAPVYAHAAATGECVVSFLSAPDDDRADKTLVPVLDVAR